MYVHVYHLVSLIKSHEDMHHVITDIKKLLNGIAIINNFEKVNDDYLK